MNNINLLELTIGATFGFFTALFTAAIYEWVRKPNLIFKIDENANEGQRSIKNVNYNWKFLNIIVENKIRPWWQSWLWGNVPAENARAWILFQDYDSKAVIREISARWSSTKQPINGLGQPDWSSILVTSRESIPVHETASVAVVIKVDNGNRADENIYGFNNESYMFYPEFQSPNNSLWSNPDFLVGDDKKYWVCIKVLTQGHEYTEKFILSNFTKSYKSIKLLKFEESSC